MIALHNSTKSKVSYCVSTFKKLNWFQNHVFIAVVLFEDKKSESLVVASYHQGVRGGEVENPCRCYKLSSSLLM